MTLTVWTYASLILLRRWPFIEALWLASKGLRSLHQAPTVISVISYILHRRTTVLHRRRASIVASMASIVSLLDVRLLLLLLVVELRRRLLLMMMLLLVLRLSSRRWSVPPSTWILVVPSVRIEAAHPAVLQSYSTDRPMMLLGEQPVSTVVILG